MDHDPCMNGSRLQTTRIKLVSHVKRARAVALCLFLPAVLVLSGCIIKNLPSTAGDPYYYGKNAAGLRTGAETIQAMEKVLTRLSSPRKWKVSLSEEGAAIQVKEDVYTIAWCDADPDIPILAVDLLAKNEYVVKLAQGDDPPFFQFNREEDARTIQSLVLKMMYLSGCPEAHPPQHSVSVDSVPSGAAVYLNERLKGVTPFTFASAEAWGQLLRLELKGYEPLAKSIDITANGSYFFTLQQLETDLFPIESGMAPPAPVSAAAKGGAATMKHRNKRSGSNAKAMAAQQKKKAFLKKLYLKNAISGDQFERAVRSLTAGTADRLVEDLISGKLSVETFREVY
jgi:hypothetical protein